MKRRSKTSPAPTARYGNNASPYLKYQKKPARYSFGTSQLHPEFYRSVAADEAGHPHRVQTGVIKARIKALEALATHD